MVNTGMMDKKSQETFDEIVGPGCESINRQEKRWIKYPIHTLLIVIYQGVFGPKRRKEKNTSRYCDIAETLISTLDETKDEKILQTSKELLNLHRTLENTEARRRLERWARKTIVLYLIVVFALVILNGLSRVKWPDVFEDGGFISDTVMTVILSTTTVNIISLGVIIIKGHFPPKDNQEDNRG